MFFFIIIPALLAVCLLVVARHIDHTRDLYTTRIELYASIRDGNFGQSPRAVEMLASRNVFQLWSVCVESGKRADVERLLRQLDKDEDKLARYRHKKNWAKAASIVLVLISAIAILLAASDAVALSLPDSWWAHHCRPFACITGESESKKLDSRSHKTAITTHSGRAPRAADPVITKRNPPRAVGSEPQESAPEPDATVAPVPKPSASATRPPHAAAVGCGMLTVAIPCIVHKATQVIEPCVQVPLEKLVDPGILTASMPDVESATKCLTHTSLGSSASGP